MKRILRNRIPFILMVGLLVTACVSSSPKTEKPDPKMADQYLAQAQALETQNNLPAALEQYKLALTVDPENATAKENQDRLSQKLVQLADERFQLGMKYYDQGKYGLARKQFLIALKYNPEHPRASKMLVSREPDKAPKYVFHTIQPGESLSQIAKHYYGDYQKYHIIARFNQLDDATKVKPGQRIMIPEDDGVALPETPVESDQEEDAFVWHTLQTGQSISKLAQLYYGDYKLFHAIAQYNGMDDATKVTVGQKVKVPRLAGVPFNVPQKETETKPPEMPESAPSPPVAIQVAPQVSESPAQEESSSDDLKTDSEPDGDEQILAYRDAGISLFNEGKFEDAVFELNKAVEAAPEDAPTRHYLSRAYLETGKQLFNQQDFKAAGEAFESALQYDPQCSQCQGYIDRSKMGPLLVHRTQGLAYFNKNQYEAAIGEFEQFLGMRPGDNEIRGYLSKAYFEQGLIDYNKGSFLDAKKRFEAAHAYDPSCEKCDGYVDQSEESYKDTHYNKGIVYYGKEQLADAIAEWEMVEKLDPDYKDLQQNLKKARTIQDRLEKIKKSSQ